MQSLAQWCSDRLREAGHLAGEDGQLRPLSGDASFRRYFRYTAPDGRSWVAVHAPPDKEKNREFIQVRALLEQAGVAVPALLAYEPGEGFLLLSDLGDQLLLPELGPDRVDGHYARALHLIVQMQSIDPASAALPAYDATRLGDEMALFPEWFLGRMLGIRPAAGEQALLDSVFRRLVDEALVQPQVFVHRDYHARNLMILKDGALATIDFQDAVIGPAFYDPVSLLKDCYVRWPRERVLGWLQAYVREATAAGILPAGPQDWVRAFDAIGLQRHIKVLGIFARLWLRDGKAGYLGDLSRVLGYTLEALALYDDFHELHDWFEHRVLPVAMQQDWFRAADLGAVRP